MVEYNRNVNKKEVKGLRRNLRKNLTLAEATLWLQLKAKRLDGLSWRRQFSIGNFILDFYCPKYKLCIELDGNEHYTMSGDTYDYDRTNYLKSCGISVLRFENNEIWHNLDGVLNAIREEIEGLTEKQKNN